MDAETIKELETSLADQKTRLDEIAQGRQKAVDAVAESDRQIHKLDGAIQTLVWAITRAKMTPEQKAEEKKKAEATKKAERDSMRGGTGAK